MSIDVGGYSFEGPYDNTGSINDESGVYAIHDHRDNEYYIIDVGESKEIKSRVETHERKDCWNEKKKGSLTVSAIYADKENREKIEQKIRSKLNIPCGEL